jgi:transcriptional regulator with XRE-family HTH domain
MAQKKVSWEVNYEKLKRDIRKRLFVKGISQAELARQLNYSPQTIRSFISGGDESKVLAMKIVDYLKLTPSVYMIKNEEGSCSNSKEKPKDKKKKSEDLSWL